MKNKKNYPMEVISDLPVEAEIRVSDLENPKPKRLKTKKGVKIYLSGDLSFDENVDPEMGQEFLAKIAVKDGEYKILSVEGVDVVDKPVQKENEENEAELEMIG